MSENTKKELDEVLSHFNMTNIEQLRDNLEAIIWIIENEKLRAMSYLSDNNLVDNITLPKEIEAHIDETFERIFNNPEKLTEYINSGDLDIINMFYSNAWTDDNVDAFINLKKTKDISVPSALYSKVRYFNYCITHQKIDELHKFSDSSLWTDENIDIYIEIISHNNVKEIPYAVRNNEYMLKKIIERKMYECLELFFGEVWSDNNIRILCENIDSYIDYLISSKNGFIYFLRGNSDFLKRLLERNIYHFLNDFYSRCWTDENKKILMNNIDSYLDYLANNNDIIPNEIEYLLKEDAYVLEMVLNKKIYRLLRLFDNSEIWNEEMTDMLKNQMLDYILYLKESNISSENNIFFSNRAYIPYPLRYSSEFLQEVLENELFEYLTIFYPEAWNTEIPKEKLDSYVDFLGKSDKKIIIPYELYSNKYLLKKILEKGLHQYMHDFYSTAWTSDNISTLAHSIISKKHFDELITKDFVGKNNNMLFENSLFRQISFKYHPEYILLYKGESNEVIEDFIKHIDYNIDVFDKYITQNKVEESQKLFNSQSFCKFIFSYHPEYIRLYHGHEDITFEKFLNCIKYNLKIFDKYFTEETISSNPMYFNSKVFLEFALKHHPEYIKYCTNNNDIALKVLQNNIEEGSYQFEDVFDYEEMHDSWLSNSWFLSNLVDKGLIAPSICENREILDIIEKISPSDASVYKLLHPDIYNPLFDKIPFTFDQIIRYGMLDENFQSILEITKSNKLDNALIVFNYLKQNYPEENDAFGIPLLLKTSKKCLNNDFQKLLLEITKSKKTLSKEENENLLFLLNNDVEIENLNVDNLKEIKNIAHIQIEASIESIIESELSEQEKSKLLRDKLCEVLTGKNYSEFTNMLSHTGDYIMLESLYKSTHSLELEQKIIAAMTNLRFIYDTVMRTSRYDMLLKISKILIEDNFEDTLVIKNYMSNYEKHIRTILELEANEKLTSIEDVKQGKIKGSKINEDGTIDLSHSEYTFYGHVLMPGQTVKDVIEIIKTGTSQICLSPISDLGKKFYRNDITVLYTRVPQSSYIGSSNVNMGSNGSIPYGSASDKNIRERFYQLGIRDTTNALLEGHAETLCWRDGLIPTAIMHRDNGNLGEEKAFAKELEAALNEGKPESEWITIPVIISQKEGTKGSVQEEDRYYEIDSDKTKGIETPFDYFSQIEPDDVYDIIEKSHIYLGGTHEFYTCRLRGREGFYFLKPTLTMGGNLGEPGRPYISHAASKLQEIINPGNSLDVRITEAPVGINGEMIRCTASEYLEGGTDYSSWQSEENPRELSQEEVSAFMHEFIVDHLMYSYDTKGDNFVSSNGRVCGIDKEQALKFVIDDVRRGDITSGFNEHEHDYSNNKPPIYIKIFEMYADGRQSISDEIFEDCYQKCEIIESMSDEEYLEIFRGFFENSIVCEQPENKKIIEEALLLRKRTLTKDFESFIERKKEEVKSNGKTR
ncbi:MAG: hypothetical protein IKJ43_04585 [Bacilli bacterium]|nr:hypothetical protein [Bacilli bacterium]